MLYNIIIPKYAGFGIILMLLGVILFFIGIILVFFNKTRKAGLILLLSGLVALISGFSICSIP